jgi:hypothetical protein
MGLSPKYPNLYIEFIGMKEEEPGNKLIQNSLSVDAQSVW